MRPVRLWLWSLVALIAATVIIGGVTRLTGSGLSITEWAPLSGVLPPLTESAWEAEFAKYRAIPQFAALNADMSLAGFKFIYWWEWTHRLLGRTIGLAFIVPFGVFWARGLINRTLAWNLGGLFALGVLQGVVGWWMVSSGLADRTDVSQYRLALHLTLAGIILAATVGVAVSLRGENHKVTEGVRAGAVVLLALIFLQIFFGALMAKTGAGLTFNTWPLIDGRIVPDQSQLFTIEPLWRNFFENVMTIQFTHRILAYVLLAVAFLHALHTQRIGPFAVALGASVLFALLIAQAILGVITLLAVSPLGLALTHQAGAIAVLIVASAHFSRLATRDR
jgi:cytochrome c oxidase assembly protein subunit 15